MSQLAIITLLGALIVICSSFSAFAEKRFALLIGNKNYGPQVGALKNPHNDIDLINKALQQVGFSVVSKKDLGRVEMHRHINEFIERLSKAGSGAVGFFYYVGHGVSNPYDRNNYLIPIDIQNMQDPDLWINALPLDRILRDLERGAPNAAHIVVFDACRNELRLPVKTGVKGFEPVTAMHGMFIAFSTSPNTAASDVGEDSGPYAQALASELIRPGQDHLTLFQNVKERVISATGRTQWPWESNGLLRFYFAGMPIQPHQLEPSRERIGLDKPPAQRETSAPASPPLDKPPAQRETSAPASPPPSQGSGKQPTSSPSTSPLTSAMAAYTQAITRNPNDADAYYGRGRTRAELSDYTGALADYQKAAEIYKQRGMTSAYQTTLDQIKKLPR